MLGRLVGGGTVVLDGRSRHLLSRIDLDTGAVKVTETGFLPHGVTFRPGGADLVAFEKKGPGAAWIRGRDVTPIAATAGRHFYGHGAWKADGTALFSVESDIGGGPGALVVRDPTDLRPIGELATHGLSPHDCQLVGDDVLAVTNGGGTAEGPRGNLAFVEIGSGRLLDRHDVPDDRFNAGHLWLGPEGRMIVVSAPRDGLPTPAMQRGAVSFGRRGTALTVAEPAKAVRRRMIGESLSVVVANGRAFVTNPEGDVVTVWEDGNLVATLDIPKPRGLAVSRDGSIVLVGHVSGPAMALTAVDPVTLAVEPAPRIPQSFVSGSHLFLVPDGG